MSMTVTDLVDELKVRTETEFDNIDLLTQALNSAQNYIVAVASPDLLMDLHDTEEITLADGTGINGGGSASLSSIDAVNNLFLSFTQKASPYMEYQIIDQQKANKLRRSTYLTPKRTNPKAYLIGQTFYSICSDDTTGGPTVVVEYISQPTEMTSTHYSGGTVACSLNPSFREALLLMAESFLWRTDDELERSSDAYNKAKELMMTVNGINARNLQEDVQKIQTNEFKDKA